MTVPTLLDPAAVRERLGRTVGRRHGILLGPGIVPRCPADPLGVYHASVAKEDDPNSASAGGGVGLTVEQAEIAALAEALERYAANVVEIPVVPWDQAGETRRLGFDDFTLHTAEQRRSLLLAGVGYDDHPDLVQVWSLADGTEWAVPAALVGLGTEHGTLATSSGLAAAFSLDEALLRAVQELVERDAFMATWLHQLPGRNVPFEPVAGDVTDELGGWLQAFDLTQRWSPHPVAAVFGMVPLEGRPRFSLGLACRSSWAEAVRKAELECLQGTVFAGFEMARHPELVGLVPDDVTDFDRHAAYYTARPDEVACLPLLQSIPSPEPEAPSSDETELATLVAALADAGIQLLGRELTTIDLHQIGLRVVRVLSPQLTPIHHDHRAPFLGGTTADRAWRYPDLRGVGTYPSPHPHPLG